MNESEQVQLSRYVDSELSPLERKGVEAALETDPAARRLAAEYALIRQYVKELPREPLGVDLVPSLHSAHPRRRWLMSLPAKSPVIAGIVAASVLITCFSVAGYVALNGDPVAVSSEFDRSVTERNSGTIPSAGQTLGITITPTPASPPSTNTVKPADPNHETVHPQIAMAPPALAGGLPAASAAKSPTAPASIARHEMAGNPPEPLKAQFDKFLKATSRIDRRHIIRLHVESISERQTDSILSIIGQFRAGNSPVMERDSLDADENLASRAYVALIPTSQIHQFEKALRGLNSVELERDKPDDQIFLNAESSRDFRTVDNDSIDRAIASAESKRIEPTEPKPGPHKKTGIEEPVADAISRPLLFETDTATADGTLDQVLVLIRTDPLRVEAPPAKTSRPVPAKK